MSLINEKYSNGTHDLTITKSTNSNIHMATITSKNDPSMNMVIPIKDVGSNTFLPTFCGTTATSGLCSLIKMEQNGNVSIPGFDIFSTVMSKLFPNSPLPPGVSPPMNPQTMMMSPTPQMVPQQMQMMMSPTPQRVPQMQMMMSPTPQRVPQQMQMMMSPTPQMVPQQMQMMMSPTPKTETNMEEIEGFNIRLSF